MNRDFDVIVVGAGPAGSAAAKVAAEGGAKVALLERGLYPGSKNLSGAGLYDTEMLERLYPNFHIEAPIERYVTRKMLGFITPDQLMSISYQDDRKAAAPYTGYTVLRPQLDSWLAKKAVEAGAQLFNQSVVTDVIKENGAVKGVIVNDNEKLYAPVVIAADGVNSFLAKSAGMQKEFKTHQMSLGVKEVISLPRKTIEDRFQLKGNEGVAFELVGSVSGLANGGGFIYTHKDCISMGLVAQLETLQEHKHTPYELMDAFKKHPAIAPMIEGGVTREYGGHLIPEGGYNAFSKLSDAGIMVTGDAAGMVLVTGYLLLGINYAIESGALAAKNALAALAMNDFSKTAMAGYDKLLEEAGVLTTFKRFRKAPANAVNNVHLQNNYADLICDVMHNLYDVGTKPIPKVLPMAIKTFKQSDLSVGDLAKDVLKIGGALLW